MMVIRDDSSFIGGESCSASLFTSPGWSKNDINTSLQISVTQTNFFNDKRRHNIK